jgi:hypothetical protein
MAYPLSCGLAGSPAFRLAQTAPLTAYSQPEAARTGFSKSVFGRTCRLGKKLGTRDITSRRWLTGEFDWLMSSFSKPMD